MRVPLFITSLVTMVAWATLVLFLLMTLSSSITRSLNVLIQASFRGHLAPLLFGLRPFTNSSKNANRAASPGRLVISYSKGSCHWRTSKVLTKLPPLIKINCILGR